MTRSVNIQESNSIALYKWSTIHVENGSVDSFQRSDRHMTWNDRVGDTTQSSVPQMHVGSADFAEFDAQ